MAGRLDRQTVVITGAASGIGLASARLAIAEGASVALLDVDTDRVDDAATELAGGSTSVVGISCDVADEAAVAAAYSTVEETFGLCSGIVAAAGLDLGPLHELQLDRWDRVVSVNLTGTFLTLKHGLRQMISGGSGGSIVCLSSPAARVAFAAGGVGAYAATKGGVSALVRAAAIDYAGAGVRVNSLVPGPTETPLMWAGVAPEHLDALRTQVSGEVPLARLAAPPEVAEAAIWLLSTASGYVTGSELVCDGGVLAKASISL